MAVDLKIIKCERLAFGIIQHSFEHLYMIEKESCSCTEYSIDSLEPIKELDYDEWLIGLGKQMYKNDAAEFFSRMDITHICRYLEENKAPFSLYFRLSKGDAFHEYELRLFYLSGEKNIIAATLREMTGSKPGILQTSSKLEHVNSKFQFLIDNTTENFMEIEIKTGKCSMIQKDNKKYDFGAYAELVSWWAENLITQEDKDTFLADFQWNNLLSILRMDGGCHSFNYTIRQSDFHHSFSIVCRLFPQEYDNQEEYIYAYTVDVSQFKEQELRNRQLVDISQKLLNISLTESLTGLYNRTAAEKFITEHIERCIREETGTLLLLDIDRFKDFNDKFGHQVGDFVLKYLSKSMQDIFRSDDILCRWGGDEFMIYMRDVSQRKNVESRVHRLRLRMQQCSHNEIPLNVTMSIGATTVKKGMTLDQLFAQCDKMLYQVKEKGRDGLMIYND